MSKTKNKLVCPRCKEEKEGLDSLYRVVLEVYSVKGATNWKYTSEANTLEDFEYRVCGQCLDKIQEYIRDWKHYVSKTKTRGTGPSNETQSLTQNCASQDTTHRQALKIGKVKSSSSASY